MIAERSKCEKQQDIYILIDGTASYTQKAFCGQIVVLQMLIAAFNPSSASAGTMFYGVTFPDLARGRGPGGVFSFNDQCSSIVTQKLPKLIEEFGDCRIGHRPTTFTSICGDGTYAIPGLKNILSQVKKNKDPSRKKAVIILTDGTLSLLDAEKEANEPHTTITNLQNEGVGTIVAARFDARSVNPDIGPPPSLYDYTDKDENAVAAIDTITLGMRIVERLRLAEIICDDQGTL